MHSHFPNQTRSSISYGVQNITRASNWQMKTNLLRSRWLQALFAVMGCWFVAKPAHAQIILDDSWADGERITQKLPAESGWFASSSKALSAATNSLSLSVGDSSVMALTYFTTNADSPVKLRVGEELAATFFVSFRGMAPQNSSQGFRLGLFNFADSMLSPKRVGDDGFSTGSQGEGVQGYALFQNMGAAFHNSKPMDIRKRTNPAGASLLGSSGEWTSLSRVHLPTDHFAGFENGTPYRLRLALKRVDTKSLAISMAWSNTITGKSLATSVTDTNAANFSFDGIALRAGGAGQSASSVVFHEVKVERAR
jgi:hypothetical protein